jgi:hypothetical protein
MPGSGGSECSSFDGGGDEGEDSRAGELFALRFLFEWSDGELMSPEDGRGRNPSQ